MDFSKHIQKAEEAERRRNYDFAVQLYQQLLDIDMDQGQARAGLRRVLKKRQEAGKGGGKLFGKLKGAGPLAMAHTMVKAGRHEAAARSLESYLATSPLDEDANLLLGQCLESAGHFASALAVYEFVAEIAPRNPEGLKKAGAMMQRKGDVPRALEYFERALEVDPRDRDAIKARKDLAAEAALSSARYEEVQHSREQIKDKDEARRLERSGRVHLSAEELEQERARLEDRYAEDPSDVELMLELAEVHEKLRDPEAALDLVERAASYRRQDEGLQKRLAELKQKALKKSISRADREGDRETADRLEGELRELEIADLERQLSLAPGNAGLRLQLGRAFVRQERWDEALAQFQKAVSDPRMRDDALFHLGQCFQQKGFLDLAREEFEKALASRPGMDERACEIVYQLGAIAEHEGKTDEARAAYSRIYSVDIGYRDVAAKMDQLR